MFQELGVFIITKQQRESYKSGQLWGKWLVQYPELFDEKDRQFFRNQAVFGYGFVESLAMIFLYNSTGYIPIFGSYGQGTQQPKNVIVEKIVPRETWDVILNMSEYHSQPPDLFVYSPITYDYFFCEVKGPRDKLRETQVQYFDLLQKVSGKPVYTIRYKLAPFSRQSSLEK